MSRVVHMLNAGAPDAMTRSTYCRRESSGGGIVISSVGPVFTFSGEPTDFEGTERDDLVTCRRCKR